jgi:hypothetical protein
VDTSVNPPASYSPSFENKQIRQLITITYGVLSPHANSLSGAIKREK